GFFGKIDGVRHGLAGEGRGDFLRGFLRDIDDHDVGAVRGEPGAEMRAKDAAAAGDDGGATGEVEQVFLGHALPLRFRISSTMTKSSSTSISNERSRGMT